MKIISKFQDYYDYGLAFGIDEKIHFVREKNTFSTDNKEHDDLIASYRNYIQPRSTYYIDGEHVLISGPGLVGFCGEFYPFIKLTFCKIKKTQFSYNYETIETTFCYDIISFYNTLSNHDIKLYNTKNEYYSEAKYKDTRNKKCIDNVGYTVYEILEKINDYYNSNYNKLKYVFEKYKVPYFVFTDYKSSSLIHENDAAYHDKITLIPMLKTFSLANKVSPEKAFQEISMFVSALNNEEEKMVVISDKDRAKAHGFDCMSFRREGKNGKKC
jgi:hypothetical protein